MIIIIQRLEKLDDNRKGEVKNILRHENLKYNTHFNKPREKSLIFFKEKNFIQEKLCFKCNKPGHVAKYCIEKNDSNMANGNTKEKKLKLENIKKRTEFKSFI
ncbi:hypothetical protein DMUE_2346 [Dictyocoela muelleri]|nr:hypothetical protein DMUE_2346 [Dictyocoela muelleri]